MPFSQLGDSRRDMFLAGLLPGHIELRAPSVQELDDRRLAETIHHAHHSAATAYDMEPYETMQVKRRFLERAVDERWTIVLDHEPGDPVVRALRDDRGRIGLVTGLVTD